MLTDIIMDSFSNDKLYGLYKMGKSDMCRLIKTFINLFKSNNYDLDKFYTFMNKADTKDKMLLKEIMKCYICYESYLNKEGLMDFNDMINIATSKLKYSSVRYKYIIIDEYQDTSISKFNFIKELVKLSDANLFVVGDDFQSIYRFAGSNVSIITCFRKYFPFAKIIKLKNTYRNPNRLVKIAGKFIMKNPYQIKKKLKSKIKDKDVLEIVYYNDLNEMVNKVIKEDKINNLFVLSRNNKDLESVNIKDINYKKLSVHKSKGLQADFVFIINLSSSYNGFPNKFTDHKILKYVNNYKEYYPYEEERRLFYVALTRCKKRFIYLRPLINLLSLLKNYLK